MGDRDLAAQAFVLIEGAKKKAPLKRGEWQALDKAVRDLAGKADDPDSVLEVTGEQLAWLDPDDEAHDPE